MCGKLIYVKQLVKIDGYLNDKHNEIQLQLLTDIAERIRHNLATETVNGKVELYYTGVLQKSLDITVNDVTVEDITNGKKVVIQITDTTTDEYQVDELRLYSAVSGYDGSGTSALYSVYTLETPITKPSAQALTITWEIQFVKGGGA